MNILLEHFYRARVFYLAFLVGFGVHAISAAAQESKPPKSP